MTTAGDIGPTSEATGYCAPSKTIEELAAEAADIDWGKHELDTAELVNPTTGQPWPRWAGSEPLDPPDPHCVCGAPWNSDDNECPMYAATRAAIIAERDQRDGPLLAAVSNAVLHIRGLPGARSGEAAELIKAWDDWASTDTTIDHRWGTATRATADMLEQAWNIIANVGVHVHTNGWAVQHPEWVQAAQEWRDNRYHPWLSHYVAVQRASAPTHPAFGRARWLKEAAAGVQPQMVTSPRVMVYLLVTPGTGIFGTYLDREAAFRMAPTVKAVVVELPALVDFR